MKTSFISSFSISHATRYQMTRMQNELVKAETESVTGRVADAGLHLGGRAGQSLSLQRDMDRLKGIVDTNAVASARLSSTQHVLKSLTDAAQDLLSTLTAASGGTVEPAITRTEAVRALGLLTGGLNTSFNGENLFAGINTDVKPINDFAAPGSQNRAALEDAFAAHFGFGHTDPQAADIGAAAMTEFLRTEVEAQFLGAGWEANWSSASDEVIVGRITLTETAPVSVSANIDGVRRLAMAAATVSFLFEGPLGDGARGAVVEHATSMAGMAVTSLAQTQAQTGIVESRVKAASERLETQINIFDSKFHDMEGVDPIEAYNRASLLLAQIETSYTITSRIRQLSLVKYLP